MYQAKEKKDLIKNYFTTRSLRLLEGTESTEAASLQKNCSEAASVLSVPSNERSEWVVKIIHKSSLL